MTLRDGLDIYRERVSLLKKGYEQERYRIRQIQRSKLGEIEIDAITSVDIANYRDTRLASSNAKTGKPLTSSTVRLEMALISNFFELARIEFGICHIPNPCKDVRKPKLPPGRDRRLKTREERAILRYASAHSNKEFHAIIQIALATAMRQGEILNLRWEHINLTTRIAHLPETKNGSKRDVPLSMLAAEILRKRNAKTTGKVFTYTSPGLKSTWRVMRLALGIEDLHFHDLRHEATSRLFEMGTLDVMEVAAITGHKSLTMLKRYTHLRATRLVKKLDQNRVRSKQVVLNHLTPYPGLLTQIKGDLFTLRLLDFDEEKLLVMGDTPAITRERAQNVLLRQIMNMLRDGRPIPEPDGYIGKPSRGDIIMIDPLADAPTLA